MLDQNTNTAVEMINNSPQTTTPVWKRAEEALKNFTFDIDDILTNVHKTVGIYSDYKLKKVYDLIPGEIIYRGPSLTIVVYTYAMLLMTKVDSASEYDEIDLLGDINPADYPGSPYWTEMVTPALIADQCSVYAAKIDPDVREYMLKHTCVCSRCKVHTVGLDICPQNCERLGI